MNTLTSGIKNWKTTIIGIALAVLTIMQDSTDLSKIEDWIFPALITALGILMRDVDKSSEASGVVPMLLVGFMLLTLPSCAFLETVDVKGKVYYVDKDSGAKGGVEFAGAGEKPSWWVRLPSIKKQKGGLVIDIAPAVVESQK